MITFYFIELAELAQVQYTLFFSQSSVRSLAYGLLVIGFTGAKIDIDINIPYRYPPMLEIYPA